MSFIDEQAFAFNLIISGNITFYNIRLRGIESIDFELTIHILSGSCLYANNLFYIFSQSGDQGT